MAEHAEKADSMSEHSEENEQDRKSTGKPNVDWGSVKDQFVGILAGIVRWVCLIFALILVLHIVFAIAEANEENSIVSSVSGWADGLTLGFSDMFTPDDEKLKTLLNYGVAAIFWLVVSSVGSALIRRVGGMVKG